jgi:hypothetical protein
MLLGYQQLQQIILIGVFTLKWYIEKLRSREMFCSVNVLVTFFRFKNSRLHCTMNEIVV